MSLNEFVYGIDLNLLFPALPCAQTGSSTLESVWIYNIYLCYVTYKPICHVISHSGDTISTNCCTWLLYYKNNAKQFTALTVTYPALQNTVS